MRHLNREHLCAILAALAIPAYLLETYGGWTSAEHYNRGVRHLDAGRYDKAIADPGIVLEIDPRDRRARLSRGLACHDRGDPNRAVTEYTRSIEGAYGRAEAWMPNRRSSRVQGSLAGGFGL